ncbi:MAG: 3-dehydroquinate synthase [Candidatus Epulonipiscioides saccharophilum]|nr:MAG: 3-dehydroquinate synthase [Epulopiscium sp. AS2M-Bin001]
MKTIIVNLGANTYPIYIESSILESAGFLIKRHLPNAKRIFIVTDSNVVKNYLISLKEKITAEGYIVTTKIVKAGEKSKNLNVVTALYNDLVEAKLTRSDAIVALGGGVIGDLTGFLASTYLRGIKFIQVPTSLLAQVDSSIGGKVAVNLPAGKNLIGSFYHPSLVIIDPAVLDTLDPRFFLDGLAEVIKYAFIKDEKLYQKLLAFKDLDNLKENIIDIIYTCCMIKRDIVERDEKDTGERMILNFGHTLGHAIEAVCGYTECTHGEGVAIGMNIVTKISEKLGLTDPGTHRRVITLLKKYNLPLEVPDVNREDLFNAMQIDKKNVDSELNLILLRKVGQAYIYKTDVEFFEGI